MKMIHIVVTLGLAFFVLNIACYCLKPKAEVVLFDAETIKGRLIRQLAEHKASDLQVNMATKKFNDALSSVLKKYAMHHGVVVINKNIALAGGKDVTAQITSELSDAMRARP